MTSKLKNFLVGCLVAILVSLLGLGALKLGTIDSNFTEKKSEDPPQSLVLDPELTRSFVSSEWNSSIVPVLSDFIRIPNVSPSFDKNVLTNGEMDRAIDLIVEWINEQNVEGLRVEIVQDSEGEGGNRTRTPIIFIEVDESMTNKDDTDENNGKNYGVSGENEKNYNNTILLYGHLDKQPPFTGWRPGLGPYTPVIGVYDKDPSAPRVLFGRGGADNGYSLFAIIVAIKALKQQKVPHHRLVFIIEASEESGSRDLIYHMETLKRKIGGASLIVCMDSSIGDYERMWLVTSLRGIVVGTLKVSLLSEGVHSGAGSGIIADSFRVARHLLSRIEDETTGEIKLKELHSVIPTQKIEQAKITAQVLGRDGIFGAMPTLSGVEPVVNSNLDMLLGSTWRPAMVITGANGLPSVDIAGNVLRPDTTLKFSIRLPPTVDPQKAKLAVLQAVENNVPYGAHVECEVEHASAGWSAPNVKNWLNTALKQASTTYYGKENVFRGSGGSIGSINALGNAYPNAQFVITGVMGPNSNAHAANEMLHIPYAEKLTMCIAEILARHAVAKEDEPQNNSGVRVSLFSSPLTFLLLGLSVVFTVSA